MTRLAFQLEEDEAAYRAAASRIREVQIVEAGDSPDALVADRPSGELPTLLVGANPQASHQFPALPWRFCPHLAALRQSLDAGELGVPGLLRVHCWSPPSMAGGEAARTGTVELTQWLVGERPDMEYAATNRTNQLLHLGFPSGAMAMLDFNDCLQEGDDYRSVCLVGSRGSAYADDHRDRNLLFSGGAPGATPPDSSSAYLQPMLEDFVASVREGATGEASASDLDHARQIVQRTLS